MMKQITQQFQKKKKMTKENEKKTDKKNLRIQNLFKTLKNDSKSVFIALEI